MAEGIDFHRPERTDHIYGALNNRVTARDRLGEIPVSVMSRFQRIEITDLSPTEHLPELVDYTPETVEQ